MSDELNDFRECLEIALAQTHETLMQDLEADFVKLSKRTDRQIKAVTQYRNFVLAVFKECAGVVVREPGADRARIIENVRERICRKPCRSSEWALSARPE